MSETGTNPNNWARQRAQMRQIWQGHLARAFPQAPWRSQTRTYAVWASLGLLMVVLGWLLLTETTETALIGRRVESLRSESMVLYRQNQSIRLQIAQNTAVQALYQRAFALGFTTVPAEQVESLVVPGYAPQPDLVLPASVTLASQAEPDEQNLGGWLQSFYQDLFIGH